MTIIEKFAKKGKAYRMGEYIVLPSWPKHQNWENKNNIYTGIVKELEKLTDDELRYVYLSGYKFPMDDILTQRGGEPPTNTPSTMVGVNYSILLHSNLFNLNLSNPALPEVAEAAPPVVEAPLPDFEKTGKETSEMLPDEETYGEGISDATEGPSLANTGNSAGPPPGKKTDGKHTPEKQRSPPPKQAKAPLREREPENDYERVEKVYLRNWDSLYKRGKVKTENPVVNWTRARALLKKHFERLKSDDITGALDRGLSDNFVMQGGYSLAVMLSATVLNRLINTSGAASGAGPPPSLREKKSLRGLNEW
jgi:hypothetical protein